MESDPYIWLEDLESERTREFIERHNRRFREYVGDLPEKLAGRVREYYRLPVVIEARPTRLGVYVLDRDDRGYYVRLIRGDGRVIDIVSSRDLGSHTLISRIYASGDGGFIAYSFHRAGSDEATVRVLRMPGMEVVDELTGAIENLVWAGGERYYYTRFYRSGRTPDGVDAPAERVFLRDPSGGEEMVFGEGIPSNHMITIHETPGENTLAITVYHGWTRSRVYAGPRTDPGSWSLVFDGGEFLAEPIGCRGESVYIVCYDGGGLGRVLRVGGGGVEEVVGEQGYPLRKGAIAGDTMYLEYLVDASSRIRAYSLGGKLAWETGFPEPSTVHSMSPWDGRLYVILGSFSSPPSLYVLDGGGEPRMVYGCSRRLDVVVEEDWAVSSDGTRVHMFVVKPRSRRGCGAAVVYGYGGFGVSITPFFPSTIAPFIEDGGALIVANIRGGSEYGEKWHRDGMRERKQNVFEDFKAALARAREKGFKTIGWGVSNGGLLIAAVLTQAPELMDAALIGYPVIDMLRFHKLYIGKLWTTEYGDPDNPRDREYLLKYSPYHNIRRGARYPPTLVYTGLHDDRVHPGHALKFAAKLEEAGAPVYLRVETASGHMGSSPEVRIKEYSDILAFIYKTLGLEVSQ